jgi:hypothetical protein
LRKPPPDCEIKSSFAQQFKEELEMKFGKVANI